MLAEDEPQKGPYRMTHPHCGLPAASTPQLPQAMCVCVPSDLFEAYA